MSSSGSTEIDGGDCSTTNNLICKSWNFFFVFFFAMLKIPPSKVPQIPLFLALPKERVSVEWSGERQVKIL
jgi:hypothetical protein